MIMKIIIIATIIIILIIITIIIIAFLSRYSAAFLDWAKDEISETDRRSCKVIDYHKAHPPKGDVHSLYIKKQERGR